MKDEQLRRTRESRDDLCARLNLIHHRAVLARSRGATVMRIDEVLDLVNGPRQPLPTEAGA